jgi:hypothetical protein
MTVDGSDERPLALGELAQADSPEIVRAALGRFRRRLLMRGLILVLIGALALFLYPRYFHNTGDLTSEIERGKGVVLYGTVKAKNAEATIFRVARLPQEHIGGGPAVERFGIHLIVRSISSHPNAQTVSLLRKDVDRGILSVRSESNSYLSDSLEMWISLTVGTPTIDIPIVGVVPDGGAEKVVGSSAGVVHIDMQKLGVPEWTWR